MNIIKIIVEALGLTPDAHLGRANRNLTNALKCYDQAKVAAEKKKQATSTSVEKANAELQKAIDAHTESLCKWSATSEDMDKLIRRADYAKTNVTNLFVPPEEQ